MVSILQAGLGIRVRLLPSSFRRSELGQYPVPDIEIAGNILARRVTNGELRDFHQTRFDRIDQSEIAHHPWKRPIRVLTDPTEKIRRGGNVKAEIDTAQFLNSIEPIDPHSGFLEKVLG